MQFSVILNNNTKYNISFIVDDEIATFCNILDTNLNFVISAGHAILSPDDDFNPVEGMKIALKRALEASPCLFDRKTRGLVWESFWEALDFSAGVWVDYDYIAEGLDYITDHIG